MAFIIQAKKIIREYREENNINSGNYLSEVQPMKTLDGAIFRRCHNQYNIIFGKSTCIKRI